MRSLELATRLIVLQPHAIDHLPKQFREKATVIFQSATPPVRPQSPKNEILEVCVVGHLRAVKDPFRTAMAARRLPETSRIQVLQIGGALTEAMRVRALREMEINPRYEWIGELSRERTKNCMARCRLLVVSSLLEGGANVVSEAIVAGVPVISTRISGSLGMLGEDYPGYFAVRDTGGLRELLVRVETEPGFLASLQQRCRALRPRFSPAAERAAWRALLESASHASSWTAD